MLTEERHARILESVRSQGFVTVLGLVKEHGVSEATIRRDLDALATAGRLRRLRGGAGEVKGTVRPEQDLRTFAEVASGAAADAKRAIAERAAQEIRDGEFICLDSGTTIALLCPLLYDRPLTVATASLAVIEALETSPTVDLIVLGGILRPSYRSMVGSLAIACIEQLRFDKAFLGTAGVMSDGTVLDSSPSEVPVKQAIMASSRASYLLADSEKFPGNGLQKVCDATAFRMIITNQPPQLTLSKEADTEVVVS